MEKNKPCLGLERGSGDRGRAVAALLPCHLEEVVPGGCPHLSSDLGGLGSGALSLIQQLEPCISPARRNLELLIHLSVSEFLRVRSKLVGQCPHTCCST